MKKLFVLVSDSGDGSYHPQYTFSQEWINIQHERRRRGELDHEDIGCDGDGFHYDTLMVPDECTLASLGIQDCSIDD